MKEGMKKRQFGISPVLCICLATLILFMLLALPGLSQAALGVSPGKIEINFEILRVLQNIDFSIRYWVFFSTWGL